MEDEVWNVIPGTNDRYEVSTHGRWRRVGYPDVLSIDWKPDRHTPDKIYGYIRPYINSKPKRILIHRAVALAHIPNSADKPCVDHINGDCKNNSVQNLRWASLTENQMNRRPTAGRSLPKGVYEIRPGRFKACFRKKHLGVFATVEEAKAAVDAVGFEYSDFYTP